MATTRIRFLAPLTTHVFNPVIRLFAGWLPGLGVLAHTGRFTGRRYHTPLLVLRRDSHYVVGLWYGSDVHWVKNVLTAGECEIRVRGHWSRMVEPELVVDPSRRLLPRHLRMAGRMLRLTEFMRLAPVSRR